MRERFVERDTALKEFASAWVVGGGITEQLQEEFMGFCGQIASRKCLRMNIRGERLDETVAQVQFAFIVAIATGRFVITDAPAASYVSTLTRNEIIGRASKDKAQGNWIEKILEEHKLPRAKRPVEEEVIIRESLRQVEAALDGLSPEQRRVVLMLAAGYTHPEICGHLQITDQILRNRIFRARQKLKEILAGSP
jgi:RNA polymerase sigma factor (sigma-70 family)